MSENGRHREPGRQSQGILPRTRAGRIAVLLVAAVAGLFAALQAAAAVVSVGRPWLVVVIIPVGLIAIAALGAIARLSQSVLPQTRLGWIAVRLFIAFLVVAAATAAIAAATGGNPWLAVLVIPLGATAFGGGAAAVVSIARRGERGALVLLPLMAGLVALVFVAGEAIVPH